MFLLSLFAIPQIPSPAVYDFYFHSVKKGTCRVTIDRNEMSLDSQPGFAEGSRLTIHYEGPTPSDATFESKSAGKIVYALNGPPSGDLKPVGKSSLFSPMQPGLLPYVLAEYDLKKGGFQTLPATDLAKNKPRTINAELFRTAARQVAGRKQTLREWRLESPPTAEAIIWTDLRNQPLEWWVPSQNFEIVRRGCESLRPSAKFEGSVSPPRFTVQTNMNVWVPMRDGVRLMADVYRPAAEGRFPVILQRTCYDRSEFGIADGEFYAQRGFVYVTEHVRGRGGSEGPFEPEVHEDVDGYDTIAWCGTQPWSDGKVGMIGASYNGFCEWMAAKTKPKWLKTFISVVPMPGSPYGAPWDGGAIYPGDFLSWFGLLRDKAKVQPFTEDITAAMNTLPLSKADAVLFGHDVPQYQEILRHDRFDASVKKTTYRGDLSKVNLPVLYFDGWLDPVAIGTRMNYFDMVRHGAKNQKLIWGPWNHFTNRESRDGVTDFTPDGYVDMRTISLRWFDRWLKNDRNGIDREPSVSEFLLGENRWHQANTWPPPNMRPERWYLQEGSGLFAKPPRSGSPSGYVYDPAKYVYSAQFSYSYFFGKGDNAADLCKRDGQLSFDSSPLKKAVRFDGPIRAKLYAATDAKDTDWVVTVLDVHPDGVAVPIQTGFVRARYRSSFSRPELLKPGEIYGYDVDLWQTGISIPQGHRVRVVVGSTLFPDMDRNLNTGEPIANATRMVVAHQKIYHDPQHASYVELPVLRGQGVD